MHLLNESAQKDALNVYRNLDDEIDDEFKEITELASLICQAPLVLITLSENKKKWITSKINIHFPDDLLDNIFCNHIIENPESILEIQNLLDDKRFCEFSLNNNSSILFCVGVPLVTKDKSVLGALWIMDENPGKLSLDQFSSIKILGKRIVSRLTIHKNLLEQKRNYNIAYQRLYQITSQSPDYIFTLDRDLNITFINHFKKEQPHNILGKYVGNFIDPEYRDEYISACQNSLREVKIIEKIFLIKTPTFRCFFSVKFCPLKDKDGNADTLLMIAVDITASRQIREELIKQQKILSEAQKISQTGSCEWDVQSGEAKFSDELYNILGIEEGVKLNHINALSERIHPDDRKRTEDLTSSAIKSFSTLLFKYRIITPKGQLKYIDGRGAPLVIKDNKVISILVTLQDITEAVNFDKKLFNAVVQSEEKERARMAGELHDGVCQYLAGSKLMLTTIENVLKSTKEIPDITAITGMIQYGKNTLSDALDLTQQISRNLLPVEFHKKGVIQSVKEMTDLLNSANSIHYMVTASGDDRELDPNISINIFRIVQEFIRNSQKYSKASEVNISIVINNKVVELEIKDNGVGFDLNSVEKKAGVGLLSMRKRIHSIGGTFTYETSPGKGVYLKLKMITE